MIHIRRILFLLAMLPVGTFAKDNFKMTSKIDGVGNDTLCIEYIILQPQKQIVNRKVAVENGIIEQKFRVKGYPYKVLISPEGTVLKAYLGETEEFYQYLDATL